MVFYYLKTIMNVNDQLQPSSADKSQFLFNKTSINNSVIKAAANNTWTKDQQEVSVTSLMRFIPQFWPFFRLAIGSPA